jgi:NO-binding membrane sensor protein with MHYT domain
MAQIHHFDHGWLTPTLSYLLSVLGSFIGLTCAVRLRSAPSRGWRIWWLSLSAVAIGGTGIWTMHFVAMLGFSVVGTPIRYDVGLTAASAVIAVVTVGLGMLIAISGENARGLRIVIGGLLAGLGVAAMHYTGMAAMRLDGEISYSSLRVAASVVIAVVAATVAIWLALTVSRPSIIFVSALVMGIAVNGMHFTGMTAMSVHEDAPTASLTGATASSLLVPIGLAVVFGLFGLVYALVAAPTDEDRAAAAYLAGRRGSFEEAPAAPAAAAKPSLWTTRGGPGAETQPTQPAAQPPGTYPSSPQQPGQTQSGQTQSGQTPPGQAPGEPAPIPSQPIPSRQSKLGGASWTYRDRTPR